MGQGLKLLIPLIIFINGVVFLRWNLSDSDLQFMVDNFLVSWTGLTEGRFWCLLTSVFSHKDLFHFFINMYVLHNFGQVLLRILGGNFFIKFYLLAGLIGSLSHALVSAFILGKPDLPALGASGAISGLVMVFSLVFPKEKLLLFGVVPIPAIWGALAFVGLDIWGVVAQAQGGGLPIGHGAHLGGTITGLITYFLFLRKKITPL